MIGFSLSAAAFAYGAARGNVPVAGWFVVAPGQQVSLEQRAAPSALPAPNALAPLGRTAPPVLLPSGTRSPMDDAESDAALVDPWSIKETERWDMLPALEIVEPWSHEDVLPAVALVDPWADSRPQVSDRLALQIAPGTVGVLVDPWATLPPPRPTATFPILPSIR